MTKAEAALIAIFRAVKPKDVSNLEIRADQIRFTGADSRRWRIGLCQGGSLDDIFAEEVENGMLVSHPDAWELGKKIKKHLRAVQGLPGRRI